MRVYPPYGRTIAKLLARGQKPAAIGVLLSAQWGYYEHVARVCIKPADWAPGRWEFGFLRNQHAVAIWGDGAEAWQFAQVLVDLMAAGPRLIWACMAGGEWLFKDDDPMTAHSYAVDSLRGRVPGLYRGVAVEVPSPDWKGPTFQEALPARELYLAAQRRALAQEAAIRTNDDAIVRAWERARDVNGYVERLFSNPYAAPDESIAA